MEYIEDFDIGVVKKQSESVSLFHKIDNQLFCIECGKQYNVNEINDQCLICNNSLFIDGILASTIAGYIELGDKIVDNKNALKLYYNNRTRKKTAVKMNNKRIIYRLLVMDKLITVGDKDIVDILRRVMWKKH